MTQQARNLFLRAGDALSTRKFLIRDRDTKFIGSFDEVFVSEDIRVIKTPVRAPKASTHVNRVVGTLRESAWTGRSSSDASIFERSCTST